MKIIAVEEHFITKWYVNHLHSRKNFPKRDYIQTGGRKLERDWWSPSNYIVMDPDNPDKSLDLGELRIKDMDTCGIDMQVLSFAHPNLGLLDVAEATAITKKVNDELAKTIEAYPKRFAGFAAIAPQDPRAAADELKRSCKELGLKGALIAGHIGEEFLDNQKYWTIFDMAQRLDVPIYLHPGPPSNDMIKPYLTYPPLALALWGFAVEASLHAMRLICSGLFDTYPGLKIILGHLGESIPFWLWRLDSRWPYGKAKIPYAPISINNLNKSPSQYFKDNFYVTTSGMSWSPALQFVCSVLGSDRILFATDYPVESSVESVQSVMSTKLSNNDKEKIFHLNAERLLKL